MNIIVNETSLLELIIVFLMKIVLVPFSYFEELHLLILHSYKNNDWNKIIRNLCRENVEMKTRVCRYLILHCKCFCLVFEYEYSLLYTISIWAVILIILGIINDKFDYDFVFTMWSKIKHANLFVFKHEGSLIKWKYLNHCLIRK